SRWARPGKTMGDTASTARAHFETHAGRVTCRSGDRTLFEYVFEPSLPGELSPRPYFHPVRTLAGVLVTAHQPPDHPWHLGLAYSWPVVDEWNLWGGPSYRAGQGYVSLADHGRIRHVAWDGASERLEWLDGSDRPLAAERRSIRGAGVDRSSQAWWLDLECEIHNPGDRPLRLGSPTTEGRPLAGYAGLAWRGPDALGGATIVLDGGPQTGDAMGRRSRWLGYVGGGVTVAFFEHPVNPRVPNRWFVRTEPYPAVSSSPVFDEPLLLDPGGRLTLAHRLLFADGAWDAQMLGRAAERWPANGDGGVAAT
ncbi:MAG: PmoA family protein, partial [Chloroflexota bacterium]|nr:PmoA family protein [Chloroflexota bacterium]